MGNFKAPTSREIDNNEGRSADEISTNIADATLDVLRDITRSNQMTMILRPVNRLAFSYIKRGGVGKNMFVHGKSALPGTIAQGLIPMQSSISKAGKDDDSDNIRSYNKENKHSIENSQSVFKTIEVKLKAIALGRKKQQLPELNSTPLLEEANIAPEDFDPLVSKLDLLDKHGNQLYIFENSQGIALRDDEKNYVYAIKEGDVFKRVDTNHEIIDNNLEVQSGFVPQKVMVLGKPKIEISIDGSIREVGVSPITADIDVLAYGTAINLNEFDKITNHYKILKIEKENSIESSGLNISSDVVKILSEGEIDKILAKKDPLIEELSRANPANFLKLADDLKKIEVLRENLRGMGDGSDVAMALTGHMRSEFSNKTEISHGAEQFNIHFTQPMDKEWVVIDELGKVSVIEGEENLLNTFNKSVSKGLSMPPNPNWGWKWQPNKNTYAIDPELKSLYKKSGNLRVFLSGSDDVQKQKIKDILSMQTQLGIESIADKPNIGKVNEMKGTLRIKINQYNKDYLEISDKRNLSNTKPRQEGVSQEKPLQKNTSIIQNLLRSIGHLVKKIFPPKPKLKKQLKIAKKEEIITSVEGKSLGEIKIPKKVIQVLRRNLSKKSTNTPIITRTHKNITSREGR